MRRGSATVPSPEAGPPAITSPRTRPKARDGARIDMLPSCAVPVACHAMSRAGQRFDVDLTLCVNLREAGLSDDLEHTVNYGAVYMCAWCMHLSNKRRLPLCRSPRPPRS